MYILRKEIAEEIKKKYKLINLAETLELTKGYISQIFGCKRTCPKTTAFAITKTISPEASIEDYFIKLK